MRRCGGATRATTSYPSPCWRGRTSPQQLRGLPGPVVGEPFTAAFGGLRVGRVRSVVPGEHLTGQILGAVMSYVLVREGATTRLLLKIVTRGGRATRL